MPTFQKQFSYAGDALAAPITNVDVRFEIPVFEYSSTGMEGEGQVERHQVDTQAFSISQELSAKTYRVEFGNEFAIGNKDRTTLGLYRQYLSGSGPENIVENLTVEATVRYLSDNGEDLGTQSLRFIHYPKFDLRTALAASRTTDRAPIEIGMRESSRPEASRTSAPDLFPRVFVAINSDAFSGLKKQLEDAAVPLDEVVLLNVIALLTDVRGESPVPQKLSDDLKEQVQGWLSDNADDAKKALEIITKAFTALYDFPLTVPELKALTIAGSFKIEAPDAYDVTAQDLKAYDLSAEFSASGAQELQVLHYAFSDGATITNDSTNFNFPDKVLRNSVKSPVTVSVKSFGTVLWSEDFKADDDKLADLDIEVDLQEPITLDPGDKDTAAGPGKKLRGQVLEFEKKCPIKDLTVVVQAKAEGDTLWRIVGAATTDSAGRFSMPYPFGVYKEAQAIVSATPDEPAPIRVIAREKTNETISDDFLYLLLKDPKCPDVSDKEDCECDGQKSGSRLPDQADLIGSDQYSQDLGGSCVNLSTPNRTLSEFNYQAIVRTSDPDVSNYVLKRIETGLETIDVNLAVLLANGSRSLELFTSSLRTTLAALPDEVRYNILSSSLINALNGAWPHVSAASQALNTQGGPMSHTVMVSSLQHLNAAIALVDAIPYDDRAQGAFDFLEKARPLCDMITTAIDALGAAARYELTGGAGKRARRPVDLDNLIAWQDDDQNLSLYQAVTVATGHILHYKSEFRADGYSLGDLIYSLPLAPGQKKEIVVFDSSHRLAGAESQTLTQGERLAAGLVDERDITTQLGGSIAESLRGSSTANTSGISAGFGTGGQGSGSTGAYGGSGSAVIGVAGGVANANSSASQDSSRNISQFFQEKLRQSITQNADSYRQLNASVVTTVQEGQQYAVTSEVIANHNHCHALTMMYFEVLRHYAVFQKLSAVEECVFVPLLMTNFASENLYKWRDVLARFLLPMPAETYLQPYSFMGSGPQHPLLKAFDANERIKTNYANVDYPTGPYDDERIRFIRGSMRLRVNLPRPSTRYDRVLSLPVTTQTYTTKEIDPEATARAAIDFPRQMAEYAAKVGATAGIYGLFNSPPNPPGLQYTTTQHTMLVRQAIFDAFMTLDANFQSVQPADCIRVTNFKPPATIQTPFGPMATNASALDFFAENEEDRKQWTAIATILGYNDVLKMLNAYFRGNLISEWDTIFYNQIAPLVFEKIVSRINLSEFSTDFSSESKYKGGDRSVRVNLTGWTSKIRNRLPDFLVMSVNDTAIQSIKDLVTLNVENISITYSTAHYNGILYSGGSSDDLLDGVNLYIPENAEEKRNPRKEDACLVYKLIEHLNSNLEYYNKALWYNLDPDRRYMLLDGFNIQIFNERGRPVGLRSLASVVKNDMIAVAGNSLVFPVAAGYKVSNAFIVKKKVDAKEEAVTLFDHYRPLTPIEPYRISVPSRGVFAEAVQGACNACEKIETERLQDWTRFPNTDEPTPIATVTPPVPAVTDWQAAFKDFAAPMVNIQNAPAAPAPAAGLVGISDLLGKSGVFKDVTGLDANQQNVIRTYLSNQENAKAFAEMAKEMAMQSHNTQNSGKIMDSLNSAKTSGALDQKDYSNLVKDHLQQQIDGGATKKEQLAKDKLSTTTPVTQIGVDGASRGKNVRLERSDSEGNVESVDVSGDGTETILAEVAGVPRLKQTKLKDCWAVATTMMMSWKNSRSMSVEDAIAPAGQKYLDRYTNDLGMAVNDKAEYIGLIDMASEPPANYRGRQYIDWMNTYGPLWLTTDAELEPDQFSLHARILVKITGVDPNDESTMRFTFLDPFTGGEEEESFADFLLGFEQAVSERPKGSLPIQVVHFKDVIESSEGGVKTSVLKAVGGKALERGLDMVQEQVTQSITGGKGSVNLPVNVTPVLQGTSIDDYRPAASYDLAARYSDIMLKDLVNDGPGAGLSGAIRLEWLLVGYRGPIAGRATAAERQGIRNTLFVKFLSGLGSARAGAAIESAQVDVTIVEKGVDQLVQPPTSKLFARLQIHIEPKTALGVAVDGTVLLALHPDTPVDYDIEYNAAGPAYFVATAKPRTP